MYDIEGTERRDDWKYNTHRNDHMYIYMMTLEYTNRKKRREKHIYLKGRNGAKE